MGAFLPLSQSNVRPRTFVTFADQYSGEYSANRCLWVPERKTDPLHTLIRRRRNFAAVMLELRPSPNRQQQQFFTCESMRRTLLLIAVMSLFLPASAQNTPQWELFGGFQYGRVDTSTILAGSVSFAPHVNATGWDVSGGESANRWLGGVIDFSGNYNTKNSLLLQTSTATVTLNTKVRVYTYMAGPQFSYRRSSRLQPFARVMVGAATFQTLANTFDNGVALPGGSKATENGFAFGPGGGVDFLLFHHVGLRAAGDYIRTYIASGTEDNYRVSAGLVFRIGNR